jgi:hypothetical protein
MSKGIAAPFFPAPPGSYDPRYMSEVVRNFALFVEQSRNPGPLRATELTLTTASGNVETGILSYNEAEDTLDLQHLNGVVQQLGFETFMQCKNDTGNTIPAGTVVGFAGVNAEIKVAPYLADGATPELYFVGVTTFDMEDGDVGPVTVYGKVRNIDTTGTPVSETWAVGDILYASPTVSGGLTNVRPTAPAAVIVVAAVLAVDATEGALMVRPTVPIGLRYGTFASTVDQTLSATNTATAITYNVTESANGVVRNTTFTSRLEVAESGYYQIAASLQLRSTNSSAKNFYVWLAKNGTPVADTTRIHTIAANNEDRMLAVVYDISLAAGDYVELFWAGSDTALVLDAVTSLAFAPDAPSALVSVTQIQL